MFYLLLTIFYLLLWQCAVRLLGKLLQCALAREAAFVGELPRGIVGNVFVLADLQLALPVRRRTLDVRQERRRASEHRLLLLAVRAPERAVEHGALVLQALREPVEVARPRPDENRHAGARDDEQKDTEPKYERAFLHPSSIAYNPALSTSRAFGANGARERAGYNALMPQKEHIDRDFLLQIVQPALIGLIDGSVSTLAPLFAAAFASQDPRIAFLVGTAAAIGAAVSMAFAEALSDPGYQTGRGHPMIRGSIVGATTFFGGIFHTLPFLLPDFTSALYLAYAVVGIELLLIGYARYYYFKASFWFSVAQVVFGGALVFLAGVLIGSA